MYAMWVGKHIAGRVTPPVVKQPSMSLTLGLDAQLSGVQHSHAGP